MKKKLIICCDNNNDLINVLRENKVPFERIASPSQAIREAEPKSGVMILADGYPERTTKIPSALFKAAAKVSSVPTAMSAATGRPASTRCPWLSSFTRNGHVSGINNCKH